MKALKSSMVDGKRKAVLKPRGLFEFVSPLAILFAVVSYVFLVALVLYIRQHPFPGYGGLTNLVIVSLVYALGAFVVFRTLYGRKRNPLETHADRLYSIGMIVRTFVYTCIAVTVFTSIILTLGLLRLTTWELFGVSVFFVLIILGAAISSLQRRRRHPRRVTAKSRYRWQISTSALATTVTALALRSQLLMTMQSCGGCA